MSAPSEEDPAAFAALDRALNASLGPWRDASTPLTLLFSGGVDSGLLGWELRARPALELLTIGAVGSTDPVVARQSASLLGLHVRIVEIHRSEIEAAARRWSPVLAGIPSVHRSVLLGFALALAHAGPGPVLCGQGADELFLGYAHFRGLDPRAAENRSASDLQALLGRDGPRIERISDALGLRFASPYLDPGFVTAARAIPIRARMPYDRPKALFRRWAIHRGLPPEVADRPKRAMQYGSGVARLLAPEESRGRSAPGRAR